MKTLEVRAGEGGVDAESFASELTDAIEKALKKESVDYKRVENIVMFRRRYPIWL
jgi:hypothetical protein